ncbi:MAG: fluoride efflux transporter CrcB [Chthoniobacterales bacterium]
MSAAYFWVALGGALGSVVRFGISEWMVQRVGAGFPWGTFLVNAVGSLLIGILAALAVSEGGRFFSQPTARAFLMTGICGGFTTFSTFSLQTLALVQDGQWLGAAANVIGSVTVCLIAVAAGFAVGGNLVAR